MDLALFHLLKMRVYHFTNAEFGLKILKERKLRISHVSKLNDPFEFSSFESHSLDINYAMKAGKLGIAEIAGIICLALDYQRLIISNELP